MISFAANQYLNRQRKYLTNDKAVINNDGKVNSSSKTSSKFHRSDFEFSGVLLTIIQTVGWKRRNSRNSWQTAQRTHALRDGEFKIYFQVC